MTQASPSDCPLPQNWSIFATLILPPTPYDLQSIASDAEVSVMLIAKDVISSCFVSTKICCMFKIE